MNLPWSWIKKKSVWWWWYIPYSLGYRLRSIESTEERFKTNPAKLQDELLPEEEEAFAKVEHTDRVLSGLLMKG